MAVRRSTTRATTRQTNRPLTLTDGLYDRRLLGRAHRTATARVQALVPALTLSNLLDLETFVQRMVNAQVLYGATTAAAVPLLPATAERQQAVLRSLTADGRA